MGPTLTFWLGGGLYGAAAIVGLLADATHRGRSGAILASALLVSGGFIGIAHAWQSPPTLVADTFLVGAGFSLAAGLVGILVGASVFADASDGPANAGQRAALMALAGLGASLAAQSGDLVTLAITLEIAAASGYAIVALNRSRRAFESAMKYFIQGAVATALLLMSVAILAGSSSPGVDYGAINRVIGEAATLPVLLGVVLLVAGLAFKAGAAPFHSWVPDAYESAPPAGGAVLAGAVKASAVTALCAAVGATGIAAADASMPLGLLGTDVFPILGALSVLSIGVGSIAALRQRSYLRMLAYAGVAQVGYALMALGAASPASALVAITTYAVATTAAFLVAIVVRSVDTEWDGTIAGLAGIGRRLPLVGLAITLVMMSMAGIPPLVGFWGKFQVLQSAVLAALGLGSQGHAGLSLWYGLLAAAGVVGAVVSVSYYGAVVRSVYAPENANASSGEDGLSASRFAVYMLGAATFVLGVVPLVVPTVDVIRGFLM